LHSFISFHLTVFSHIFSEICLHLFRATQREGQVGQTSGHWPRSRGQAGSASGRSRWGTTYGQVSSHQWSLHVYCAVRDVRRHSYQRSYVVRSEIRPAAVCSDRFYGRRPLRSVPCLESVASPAMGHWGTCSPRLRTISFLVHFRVNPTDNYQSMV